MLAMVLDGNGVVYGVFGAIKNPVNGNSDGC